MIKCPILAYQGTRSDDCDGGLYVGLGGVGYMLWYASTKLHNKDYLSTAQKFLTKNAAYYKSGGRLRPSESLGFLLGKPGIDAVLAVLSQEMGIDNSTHLNAFKGCAEPLLQPDPLGRGSDEMLVGRAGYILGALWLKDCLGTEVIPPAQMFALCDTVVRSGRAYSEHVKSPCPLMYQYHGTEYLGAAHGLSGILQALLSVPGYFNHNPSAEKDVKASVDYFLSLQNDEGNFPCATDETGARERPPEKSLIHWCHGAPGVVYLLARAYQVWKEQRYVDALKKGAECVWNKGLLKKGPGICHGVAGSGYVFLLLYRLTQDTLYLYRAEKFGEFLFDEVFQAEARQPDRPLSLYEGLSGTVCYLLDLAEPDKAAFPFSDVVF